MTRYLPYLVAAVLALAPTATPSIAADAPTDVKVALLDISSIMVTGMGSYGMMAPGGAQGQGMMNPGMTGPGTMMAQGMMSIRLSATTVKAGTVRFDVTNWSRSVVHNMLVIPVDNPTAPLPYDYAQGRVPEDQVKVIAAATGLEPDGSAVLEVTLGPGSYLLICNLPGHYAAGMAVPFNVMP
jgi:uncharacterized cupredoxin-like copper-binding protein